MRRTGFWLWSLLVAAAPLGAGVEVVPEAARTGSYGLRATVEAPCDGEEAVLVVDPVVTAQRVDACREAVVGAEVRDGGELVVSAGRRVAFLPGFAVGPGGRLVAGTTGTWDPAHVVDETPAGEPELHLRWHARFDQADLPPGEELTVLRLVSSGLARGWVRYRAGPDGGKLWVEALTDAGALAAGERIPVAGGWHRLDLEWQTGSPLAPTGSTTLRLDGGAGAGVLDVALAGATVDTVELGVVTATAAGGWLDLDDYTSGREPPADLALFP